MILLDANLLLYAANQAAPEHDRARNWLDAQLSLTLCSTDGDFARFKGLEWENPLAS